MDHRKLSLFAMATLSSTIFANVEFFMAGSSNTEICRRIAQLRLEVAGPRGKSSFAKQLGLSPSTYDYYEATRVPPAEVLVRIAELAHVDLRWLLTGQTAEAEPVPTNHPVLLRAASLIDRHPDAARALGAFIEIFSKSLAWPADSGGVDQPVATTAPPPAATTGHQPDPKASWIPILGRSAAGVPQFWTDADALEGVTTLGELVARHTSRAGAQARPAVAELASGFDGAEADTVQVISLAEPDSDEFGEFVASAELRARWPDAFAVRIDGQSMAPDIRHGDIVILSTAAPAADGRPAIVQLAGQIGVTCKLYRRDGQTVHLVPINEQVGPVSIPADQVVWALRVLARVRVQAARPG